MGRSDGVTWPNMTPIPAAWILMAWGQERRACPDSDLARYLISGQSIGGGKGSGALVIHRKKEFVP